MQPVILPDFGSDRSSFRGEAACHAEWRKCILLLGKTTLCRAPGPCADRERLDGVYVGLRRIASLGGQRWPMGVKHSGKLRISGV